jgi:hypothetical protein
MLISADGVFELPHPGASRLTLHGSGTFGGATVTVGYFTNNRTFKPILEEGGVHTTDFEMVYIKGSGVLGAVSVSGATTTAIEIQVGHVS